MGDRDDVELHDLGEHEAMRAEDETDAHARARRTWRRTAHSAVANNFIFNKQQKEYYYQHYTCIPNCKDHVGGPPIFILTVTLLEIAFFIYYAHAGHETTWWTISTAVINSPLLFSPYHREQVWRFFTYMLLHAGVMHLAANCIMQLAIGIPLELVHGSLRIMGIYMLGVLAGSLGSSVFDVGTYLVGASGGDFALMFAFLSNIIMNWDYMKRPFAIGRLVAVLTLIFADFGMALYRRYGEFTDETANRTSYAAHLAGAVAGLTMGIAILNNFKRQKWEDILLKVSIAIFVVIVLVAIFFNIFCPCYDKYTA